MTRIAPLLLAAVLACAFPMSPARAAQAVLETQTRSPRCGDMLARLHKKPPHVTYDGCHLLSDHQGKPLRATYRVQGRFARQAETYLIKAAGLRPLKRSCCQWDTTTHAFKGRDGAAYSITMVSVETAVTSRAAWGRIPTFEIVVETFTEEI